MYTTLIRSALLVTMLSIAGCKGQSAQQTQPSSTPASSASAQLPSEGPSDFVALIEHDTITASDIQSFLIISEGDNATARLRVFNTPESDFVSQRLNDPEGRVKEYINISASLRAFARATINRGNALREAGDTNEARRHYQAVVVAADANGWEGVALIGKLTADAMRKAAEEELAKLSKE